MMNVVDKRLNKYLNKENLEKLAINNFSLKPIKAILKILNNPQEKLNIIHIAGTNGKGTTAHILNEILINSGYKVGLYTSPHLLKINERIRLNNKQISNYKILKYLDIIESVSNGIVLSYFDILTIIAFLYFENNNMDFVIMETGLGGRLDSTNIAFPLVSLITDISLDHQNILGNTIEKITYEKCGIIKKNGILVTSNEDKKILGIIKDNTKRKYSELYLFNKDFYISNLKILNGHYVFDYKSEDFNIKKIESNLLSYNQLKNLSLAITVLKILLSKGYNINPEIIKKSCKNLFIPGRFQTLLKDPVLIFDPAHNISSIECLIEYVKTNYKNTKLCIITCFMSDKNPEYLLDIIKKHLKCDIFYLLLNTERCYAPSNNNYKISEIYNEDNIKKLLNTIIKNNYQHIIITGTFRLYKYALRLAKEIKLFDSDCFIK